jgi:transcriptional regulator NrdR family protein
MVCILCDSNTKTSNTRTTSRGYQKWRRHTCLRCSSVFTTREVADLSISYRFQQKDGQLAVFSRDELFLGVLDAVRHLPEHVAIAGELTSTITTQLQCKKRLLITRGDVITACADVLRHYNLGASQIYRSQHPL